MRTKVLTLAHQIKAHFTTWGDAQRAAWRIIRMFLGYPVQITFANAQGELREAEVVAIGSLSTLERGFLRFVEIVEGKSQWRSFRLDRLVFL